MSVTLLALLKIEDKTALENYRKEAANALAKHGGSVVKAGPLSDILEGEISLDTAAILEFPDRSSAEAWHDDPELQPIHKMRNAAGLSTVVFLG